MKLADYKLFLDDERMPGKTLEGAVVVRDFWQFKNALLDLGIPKFISFDHDLGCNRHTGKSCAEMLYVMIYDDMPEDFADFRYDVHSQNPVGAANIRGFMDQMIREVLGDN